MAKMFLERKSEETSEPIDKQQDWQESDDEALLELAKACKKESFQDRWIWERAWMRNIHYINNRHWIEYVRRSNEWRDVRLAKWFPKPVNPLIAQGVQALRAMFASVDIGVNVRPNGNDPQNVAVAQIADDYGPVLHEEHEMEAMMDESDFWFLATGNAFIHTFFEKHAKHGFDTIEFEACAACGTVQDPEAIAENPMCSKCGSPELIPATDPKTGEPLTEKKMRGKGKTVALSAFEIAFPSTYARFEDVPYIIRLRWRSKDYYVNHPVLGPQTKEFLWSKAPSETSLQLFRSLPYHNDMGIAPFLGGGNGQSDEEGAPEYEYTFRPCDKYPQGFVFRVLGDGNPIILHQEEDEAIPGPLPYRDAEDNPLFTYEHAAFEQRGGRVWGTSPLDGAIQKVNQLNQLDAFGLMIVNRMGNPLWLVPKGAEIEKFTGEPGLVVKWNPLTVGGNAKPERIDGMELGAGFFQLRAQYVTDVEEALGTSDILKGSKPAGIDAFAALQLMVERAQSRHASAFKARGRLYKSWFKFALEIERDLGPDNRTRWVAGPGGGWSQQLFERAQLQGSFQVIVEEGSQTPKTALGMRAAIQHLFTLGMIDPVDSDQRYAIYQLFGQTRLSPSLDTHKKAALRKQQAFEDWAADPAAQQESFAKAEQEVAQYEQSLQQVQPPPTQPVEGAVPPQADPATGQPAANPDAEFSAMQAAIPPPPSMNMHTPLAWKPWFKADIHKQEFLKWANSDRIVELLTSNPALEQLLVVHLQEMDIALQEQAIMAMGPQPPAPGGAGMAMQNSNQEAGSSSAASQNVAA